MLHELLFALSGYPGSIFIHDDITNTIKVVADLPFISPTEVALLNRVCKLATHHIKFRSFITRYSQVSSKGLYVRAFCHGLDDVLEPYRQALLTIERQLLADPHLTAAYVQSELEEYQQLFPTLSGLVDQIVEEGIVDQETALTKISRLMNEYIRYSKSEKTKSQKIQERFQNPKEVFGCRILEMLHQASACGMPNVKAAVLRILHTCHGVLYKQMASWMLHGLLLDQLSEFFIQQSDKDLIPAVSEAIAEDELGLGGITGRQLQQIMQITETENSSATSYKSFSIKSDLLPNYIPLRAAEKILFVGESVQMFDQQRGGKQSNRRGSILMNKEDEFARDICTLAQQPIFDLITFEGTIDKMRSFVAEQLWHLVVEEADLTLHLRHFKDFFLLGRGELFLAFIDQSQTLLRTPPTTTTQHDVNLAFQHAARNVFLEDEALLQHFKLLIEDKQAKQTDASQKSSKDSSNRYLTTKENGWRCLNLTYLVDWPLHILFTQNVLSKYNMLFTFLLYVKRIQMELQQCWALQMQRRHLHCDDPGASKWWLRNHMAFLVDNLQYYLQVDVIESQFSLLLDKIHKFHDFEEIRLAHDQFLSSLLNQGFLHMKQISHCLGEILELCHSFCGLMFHSEVILSTSELSQLDEIAKAFQRQSSLLFKVLSSVRSHQTSPHLAQLLLRIDFNKYFTLAGGQLGGHIEILKSD